MCPPKKGLPLVEMGALFNAQAHPPARPVLSWWEARGPEHRGHWGRGSASVGVASASFAAPGARLRLLGSWDRAEGLRGAPLPLLQW